MDTNIFSKKQLTVKNKPLNSPKIIADITKKSLGLSNFPTGQDDDHSVKLKISNNPDASNVTELSKVLMKSFSKGNTGTVLTKTSSTSENSACSGSLSKRLSQSHEFLFTPKKQKRSTENDNHKRVKPLINPFGNPMKNICKSKINKNSDASSSKQNTSSSDANSLHAIPKDFEQDLIFKKNKSEKTNNSNLFLSRENVAPTYTKKSDIFFQQQNLPIFPVKNELLNNIFKNKTVILIGETACGKTTQIPQFLLQTKLAKSGKIGITQPRRVAAVTIATRVALEVGTTLGDLVGYSVRFEDVTSDSTKIKYLTDGMMLREAISDPLLKRYRVIILDEAHERTIHTDVLFGIVKNAQATRKGKNLLPLKVIVMSATMDVDHFSSYFDCAPVFYLKGRQFPIEVMHALKEQRDYIFAALVTVFQIHRKDLPGDILVFCTGQEEIESLVKSVEETSLQLPPGSKKIIALPLYSSLSSSTQLKVFQPTPLGYRKVIFSTNIAETSVTIPGIMYVVDTGVVKARTYYPTSGLDLLKVQKISKAQAWQRAGRAGREASGICFRLYTEEDFKKLKNYTVPEIQRCNLANVVLQLLAMGIRDIHNFDFIDKPAEESLESAFMQLKLLGAIEDKDQINMTPIGRKMVIFPLEPRFAKLLLMSKDLGCTDEILALISMLSVDSVFHTPSKKKERAAEARRKFESNEGDHLMLLNVYRGYKSSKGSKEWCQENFIHRRNLQQAVAIRKQLADLCSRAGIPPSSCSGQKDSTAVRRCLVSGLFMNAAELQQGKQFCTFFMKWDSLYQVCLPQWGKDFAALKFLENLGHETGSVDPPFLLPLPRDTVVRALHRASSNHQVLHEGRQCGGSGLAVGRRPVLLQRQAPSDHVTFPSSETEEDFVFDVDQ